MTFILIIITSIGLGWAINSALSINSPTNNPKISTEKIDRFFKKNSIEDLSKVDILIVNYPYIYSLKLRNGFYTSNENNIESLSIPFSDIINSLTELKDEGSIIIAYSKGFGYAKKLI